MFCWLILHSKQKASSDPQNVLIQFHWIPPPIFSSLSSHTFPIFLFLLLPSLLMYTAISLICTDPDSTEILKGHSYATPISKAFLNLWDQRDIPSSEYPCCCSVSKLCLTFEIPMSCRTLGFHVHPCLSGFDQTHVHWWCYPTISSSVTPLSFAFSLSQHQGLFQWISSLHHVAKILELKLQHLSFQWIFRVDFL